MDWSAIGVDKMQKKIELADYVLTNISNKRTVEVWDMKKQYSCVTLFNLALSSRQLARAEYGLSFSTKSRMVHSTGLSTDISDNLYMWVFSECQWKYLGITNEGILVGFVILLLLITYLL